MQLFSCENKGVRHQRTAIGSMPCLTMEEVEQPDFAAKLWTAPGDDGAPTFVWKQTWLAVKDRVLAPF